MVCLFCKKGGFLKMNIAIYCGSVLGNQKKFEEKAVELGSWMSRQSYDMVYGGSKLGLMGVIARKMLQEKRQVYGVLPTFLQEKEIAQEGLTELYFVGDMHERKQKMMDLSDVFIAMPGGPGTLEEISEVISWSRIGQHNKPCIFYNVEGYYDLLAQFFDKMVVEGFLGKDDRQAILFSDSVEEIASFIAHYQPPAVRVYDNR